MKKRILSVIMVVAMLVSFGFTVFAEYENDYVNTGDNRADIVAVATTQAGYIEGEDNFTKYGEWYGLPNIAWTAVFVSWCAAQADISTDIIPKFSSCETGQTWFDNKGLLKTAEEYTPQSGDIVFYDWDVDGTADHIGIIDSVEGTTFSSIEGNYTDEVKIRTGTSLLSNVVLGFGTPEYEDNRVIPPIETGLKIKAPSTTIIYYGDILVLQAEIDEIPEGTELEWSVEGEGVTLEAGTVAKTCKATSVVRDTPKITVKLVDAEGNVLTTEDGHEFSDSIIITSKVNILWKILSFFKNIFGMNRLVY